MRPADGVAIPRWLGVPGMDAAPQFLDGYVEIPQFDAHAQPTSNGAHLVTLDPRPEPEIKDDAQPQGENFLSKLPESVFDPLPVRLVPRAGAERPEPFIL